MNQKQDIVTAAKNLAGFVALAVVAIAWAIITML
jgi:hypothetical protein